MSPSRKSATQRRSRGSHATGRHGAALAHAIRRPDPPARPHVATIVTLGAIGWYVTEIRPDIDRDAPVLWHVTITRYDKNLSITLAEADPDVALEELARYAAADAARGAPVNALIGEQRPVRTDSMSSGSPSS